MTDDIDALLTSLLKVPEREPDPRFVRRVRLEAEAEKRFRSARRGLLRKLGSDVAGAAAIVLVFIVLALAEPPGPQGKELILFSPAMLGVLLLGLWAAATLPAGTSEARG